MRDGVTRVGNGLPKTHDFHSSFSFPPPLPCGSPLREIPYVKILLDVYNAASMPLGIAGLATTSPLPANLLMARRSRSREVAFQVLYQDDLNPRSSPAVGEP